MPRYSFRARNFQGELVEGTRTASSDKDLVGALRGDGLIVFSITETKDGASPAEGKSKDKKNASGGGGLAAAFPGLFGKKAQTRKGGSVGLQEIAVVCRQWATLVTAGVSILDTLEDLSEMTNNKKFHEVLKTVADDMRAGSLLSDAIMKHQKIFGKVFVSLVTVGEKSGKLGKVLMDLAAYMENTVKLQRKVKAASSYPIFVGVFFALVVSGLVLFLIPRFQAMFESFGAELPLPTKIVVAVSNLVIHNLVFIILFLIAAVFGYRTFRRTPGGRMMIDRAMLDAPILGPIMFKVTFARFFQTMATLLRSGVDIVASLEIASRVADNVVVEQKINSIRNRVVEGSTLSAEMERSAFFPKMVVRMSSVGEKSGKLDEMFGRISEYYSDEVDAVVASLSAIIEPVLIVSLGGVVGVVVVAMYLPVFKLAGAMAGGG